MTAEQKQLTAYLQFSMNEWNVSKEEVLECFEEDTDISNLKFDNDPDGYVKDSALELMETCPDANHLNKLHRELIKKLK